MLYDLEVKEKGVKIFDFRSNLVTKESKVEICEDFMMNTLTQS